MADRARDGLSSWIVVAEACAVVAVGIAAALRPDDRTGPVTVVGLVLSGVAVVELPLVLMAPVAPIGPRQSWRCTIWAPRGLRRPRSRISAMRCSGCAAT